MRIVFDTNVLIAALITAEGVCDKGKRAFDFLSFRRINP